MAEPPKTRPSLLVRLRDPQDEQAWEELLRIYEPLVYRLARRRGLQHADAVELAQEVFLAVASAIERWEPDPERGRFRTWLFRIARNMMINWLAKQRRHPQAAGGSEIHRLLEDQADPASEDSELFEKEYRQETFHWAAEQVRGEFTPTSWEAFWRTSVEGKPVREVSAELGLTPGAVYIARSRVMARLRRTVQGLESE